MLSRIEKYFNGELSEKEALEMQIWLAGHSDDPEVMKEIDRIFDAMSETAMGSSSCDAESRRAFDGIRDRLGLGRTSKRNANIFRRIERAAAIMAIPLMLAAGILYMKSERPEVAWLEVNVPSGQIDTVSLADGSMLVLNSGSRVTYPQQFKGTERRVFIEGEVLADIAKDPEKPFIIQSGDVNVRVHGTKFDFKSYGSNNCVELLLMEGSVSLDVNCGEAPREVRMKPGDMVHYDRNSGDINLTSFNPQGFKTFANGSLHFINLKMSDIAKDLERIFDVRIAIMDKTLADTRILAFFSNNEDLDQILSSMNTDRKMKIRKKDGIIYLSSSR